MTRHVTEPHAQIEFRWLRSDEGGRSVPPPGPTYAATAILAGASASNTPPDGQHFSLIIEFEARSATATDETQVAIVEFFDIEHVRPLLEVGRPLSIMEGPRRVAEGVITRLL